MRPFKALISLDEAIATCTGSVKQTTSTQTLEIEKASGRVVSEDVRAKIFVPLTDRAAMDGFAVKASNTFGANKFHPKILKKIEVLYASTAPKKVVTKGKCTQVATGSTVPKGADAVVMVEDTSSEGDAISIFSPVHPMENVSSQGEDIRKGEKVIFKGEVLTPAKTGALAAVGTRMVRVYRKPTVAILTTGDEVIEPGKKIRPGQVFDINAYTLSAVIKENGGDPKRQPNVHDDIDSLHNALAKAARNDLVVFSGGSSVGEKDLIMDALNDLGQVFFHGVAVKPGKPTVFGLLKETPVLGMPGYPTSCLSNAYMILVPILRKMARLPPKREVTVELPLSRRIVSTIGRVEFHTVKVEKGRAVPVYKESGAITSMANADGYIKIPANVDLVEAGETVEVIFF